MREITNEDHHRAHFATWVGLLIATIALMLAVTNYFHLTRLDTLDARVSLLIDQADVRLDNLEKGASGQIYDYERLAPQATVENSATIVSGPITEN